MRAPGRDRTAPRDLRKVVLAAAVGMGLVACGQPGGSPGSGGAPAGSGAFSGAPPAETSAPSIVALGSAPPREMPLLAPGERRVVLLVVPGDALVDVDGQPVRRRNGVVDLTGKVGDVRRVRVRGGSGAAEKAVEKSVTIEPGGASPPLVDLNEPAAPGAAGHARPKAMDLGD